MNWYKIMKVSNANWIKPVQFSPDKYSVVDVNVAKFDKVWQENPFYVGPSGTEDVNPAKYKAWQQRHEEGFTGEMPSVRIGDADIGKPIVGFDDGRHRYATARDSGVESIPMMVPKDQEKMFLRMFS